MLNIEQYTTLWTNAMNEGGFEQPLDPCHCLPCYQDYVIRENQLQDYLDIFRRRNTRTEREENNTAPIGGWYYEHPFENYLRGELRPISKIMIAEAAPPLSPIVLTGINDRNNSYFYDITHTGTTGYFTEPCQAFDIRNGNKNLNLYNLALNGVLLLDLFPFAVSYSTKFRRRLVANNVHAFFWQGAPESIENRITALRDEDLLSANENEPKLALLAPHTISNAIALRINDPIAPLPTFETFPRMGANVLDPPGDVNGGFINLGATPSILNGVYPTDGLRKVPYYACTCYSGAGFPHRLLIQSAFSL
jgi:hypothetical protein